MQCLRCDSQNKSGNDYCESCGAALGIKCDACNNVNGPTIHFCGQCGATLVLTPANRDPSPQRLLRSLSTKGGERKRLTVLFADIRNSTSLIDSLGDPELAMQRLEPVLNLMADEGCILITRDTYVGAKQFVEVIPLGEQTIRGIAAPVETFRLTGLLNAPASDVFRSGRRLTPMIGRNDQLAALELELVNTFKGDGRVVGVVGEAGIGKSRLCFEFAEACR